MKISLNFLRKIKSRIATTQSQKYYILYSMALPFPHHSNEQKRKMHSTAISQYTLSPSFIRRTNGTLHRKPNNLSVGTSLETQQTSFACKASNSSYSSSITDIIDLYELLGVDTSCNQAQIKSAYRSLQKRCHPDIAGPAGHDMAIILNEAYTVLSDPSLRLAYDKEQAKVEDLRGYTGKPIYSVWLGSENENRSVFVDEVKCVGCLKCALLAEKTFAVESTYGRARVVAQWADPEDKIQAAIEACPVDCISVVPRSDLAALEFLMSKKERGRVRIGAGNAIGPRSSNVFDDLEKFQARYTMTKAMSKEQNVQRKSWASAIQGIRSVSNWFYWQAPIPISAEASDDKYLTRFKGKPTNTPDPDLERLKKVVSEAREYKYKQQPSNLSDNHDDEYWEPSNLALPAINDSLSKPSPTIKKAAKPFDEDFSSSLRTKMKEKRSIPFSLRVFPLGLGAVAAFTVRLQQGEEGAGGGLEGHIAGALVRDIVNSTWLQVFLAGVTWYLIGLYMVQVVRAIQVNVGKYEQK